MNLIDRTYLDAYIVDLHSEFAYLSFGLYFKELRIRGLFSELQMANGLNISMADLREIEETLVGIPPVVTLPFCKKLSEFTKEPLYRIYLVVGIFYCDDVFELLNEFKKNQNRANRQKTL